VASAAEAKVERKVFSLFEHFKKHESSFNLSVIFQVEFIPISHVGKLILSLLKGTAYSRPYSPSGESSSQGESTSHESSGNLWHCIVNAFPKQEEWKRGF
jgi:hypothetical protein